VGILILYVQINPRLQGLPADGFGFDGGQFLPLGLQIR